MTLAGGSQTAQITGARSMGHIALHYPTPEAGPAAAKLLKLLGFVETQMLPLPGGNFYRFVVDPKHSARGDGIVYLSAASEPQRNLIKATREALKVGSADEHPAVQAMRDALVSDPEVTFHVGVLMDSLEDLERVVQDVQAALTSDPDLKGHGGFAFNRARAGDPDVDARLDSSPVYGKVERYAYGRNGVQAFLETDLLTSGPLGESTVIELDYVFPGKDSHILSVVEL